MGRAFYLVCVFILLLTSCKGTKSFTESRVKKLSAAKVISNHYNRSFNFETLNARLKVRYDDGKKSFSPNVTVRIKKDEVIWISAKLLGISLAKVMITPEKVSYFEKINNTYFEGDFEILSTWLGTELDFKKVQQLLLGQALFNLREDKYTSSITSEKYQLSPKKELELFERLFLVNPDGFKMHTQQLKQPLENRNLMVNYKSYQKIGNQDFPKEIFIEAMQEQQRTTISIEYRAVDYNARVSFPFKIPSGYEEVTIQ